VLFFLAMIPMICHQRGRVQTDPTS